MSYIEFWIVIGCVALMWAVAEILEFIATRLDKPNIMKWVCLKCYSFWFTLIVCTSLYGWIGILMGAIGGLIGYFLDKSLEKIEV